MYKFNSDKGLWDYGCKEEQPNTTTALIRLFVCERERQKALTTVITEVQSLSVNERQLIVMRNIQNKIHAHLYGIKPQSPQATPTSSDPINTGAAYSIIMRNKAYTFYMYTQVRFCS